MFTYTSFPQGVARHLPRRMFLRRGGSVGDFEHTWRGHFGRRGPRRTLGRWIVKKLSLNIDALEISTFETARVVTETGTVEAFAATKHNQYTCDPVVGTCFGYTCAGAGC